MPKITASAHASTSPDRIWQLATDPARYPDWLTLHQSFPGPAPARLDEGTEYQQRLTILGVPVEVAWLVTAARSPELLESRGKGPMGVKAYSAIRIEPVPDGTRITLEIEFEGAVLAGPAGKAVANEARTAAERSVANLSALLI
jgi:hypothetical protein